MNRADVSRELGKAEQVLAAVERYLVAHNESMAALHMSDRVVPSPLTAAVMPARMDLQGSVSRLASEAESTDQWGRNVHV